mmetsp:Transcript_17042/g.31870  ORF Transcript_17042/g.31870 Transcript_17042/m.31870 type:complete len:250 (+) Transcript_17042:472-1221(+)
MSGAVSCDNRSYEVIPRPPPTKCGGRGVLGGGAPNTCVVRAARPAIPPPLLLEFVGGPAASPPCNAFRKLRSISKSRTSTFRRMGANSLSGRVVVVEALLSSTRFKSCRWNSSRMASKSSSSSCSTATSFSFVSFLSFGVSAASSDFSLPSFPVASTSSSFEDDSSSSSSEEDSSSAIISANPAFFCVVGMTWSSSSSEESSSSSSLCVVGKVESKSPCHFFRARDPMVVIQPVLLKYEASRVVSMVLV